MHRLLAIATGIRGILPAAALLAAVCLLASSPKSASASFEPEVEASLSNPAPGAHSDLTIDFSLPEGDVMPERIVASLPPEWGVVEGTNVPLGARVGRVRALATLGLINSPCNQILEMEFTMLNASLDTDDPIDFYTEDGGGDPTTVDWAEDIDDDRLVQAIDQWPEFLDRVLADADADPISRIAGMSIVASTPVLLQFVIFPPGAAVFDGFPAGNALGYPVVALLQDFGDPQAIPKPGVITDLCTPLVNVRTEFFGVSRDNEDTFTVNESGVDLLTNPQAGAYTFTVATTSQRDADGDGYENRLDTCALVPNVGNPRIPNSGDDDSDGLDKVCDPNDNPGTGGTNSDQDGDGYVNRQDNCPIIDNGEADDNQADADLDGIGDVCDPDPNNADAQGVPTLVCPVSVVHIGSARSPGTVSGGVEPCLVPEPADPAAKGNIDCDNDVDSVDALQTLRFIAGLDTSQAPGCPSVGPNQGDIDCDGDVDAVDALLILRFIAGLPVALPPGCPAVGTLPA